MTDIEEAGIVKERPDQDKGIGENDLPEKPVVSDFEDIAMTREDIDNRIASVERSVCGQIHNSDNNVAVVLAAQDTFYQVTSWENSSVTQFIKASPADGQLVVIQPGLYQILVSMSFSTTATANTYEVEVQLNRGTKRLRHLHAERKTSSGGDIGSISISGFEILKAADSVELWVERTDGGGTSKTFTMRDANLSVIKVD